MTTPLVLTGLDGTNPLAFLAALGTLTVVSERAERSAGTPPTLAWREDGIWQPVLTAPGIERVEELLDLLLDDRDSWRTEPALEDLAYEKPEKGSGDGAAKTQGKGKRAKGGKAAKAARATGDGDEAPGAGKVARDLKPTPTWYREFVSKQVAIASRERRRTLDFLGAFASETVTDQGGVSVKPTALHFTAGQQELLKAVRELRDELRRDDLVEALLGPWSYARELPVLGWDATATRDYALRASDPSTDKKRGVPVADWLAFRALSILQTAPMLEPRSGRLKLATTACSGGWKDGHFTWCLWEPALTRETIAALLRHRGLDELGAQPRRLRGIATVLRSAIRRTDQGGYGSMGPAEVR